MPDDTRTADFEHTGQYEHSDYPVLHDALDQLINAMHLEAASEGQANFDLGDGFRCRIGVTLYRDENINDPA